jgi:hypothetical protein
VIRDHLDEGFEWVWTHNWREETNPFAFARDGETPK